MLVGLSVHLLKRDQMLLVYYQQLFLFFLFIGVGGKMASKIGIFVQLFSCFFFWHNMVCVYIITFDVHTNFIRAY